MSPAAAAQRRARVDEVMALLADQVAALPAPSVKALQPILQQAQAEVAADLAAWLAKHGEDGAARFTAQQLRVSLAQLEESMRVLGMKLPTATAGVARDGGTAAGRQAIDDLHAEIATFSMAFGDSVRPLALNQAVIMARGDRMMIPKYRTSAARYGTAMTADLRSQLAIGVLRGETYDEMTSRLVAHGGPKGLVSLRGVLGEPGAQAEFIAEGLFKRYRGWGERVVRTEVNRAYNTYHLEGLYEAEAEDPGYQKRWDATVDGRTCPICAKLDGVAVDLDDPFPGGVPGPPIHPNDRCAVTPWRAEWGKSRPTGKLGEHEDVEKATKAPKPPPKAPVLKPKAPKAPKAPPQPPPPPPRPAWIGELATDPSRARTLLAADLTERYRVHQKPLPKQDRLRVMHWPSKADAYHDWDGEVLVKPEVLKGAQAVASADYAKLRLAMDAIAAGRFEPMPAAFTDLHRLATLVHEEVHGFGGLTPAAYRGAGAFVEEVATETLARRYMVEAVGLPREAAWPVSKRVANLSPQGGYVRELHEVVSALSAELGDVDAAVDELQRAATSFKATASSSLSPEEAVDDFVASFSPRVRPAIRGLLVSKATWKAGS